jgi:hypothetical protein
MRAPRVRFTIRRMMVAVVVMAIWLSVLGRCPPDALPMVIQTTATVCVPIGLCAIRFPLITLSVGVLIVMQDPNAGGACNPLITPEAFAGGWLGWLVGAPAGWISRGLRAPNRHKTARTPGPEELLIPSGRGSIPAATGASSGL